MLKYPTCIKGNESWVGTNGIMLKYRIFFIDHHFLKWDRELHFSVIEWPKKIMTHGIINRQMHSVWGGSQRWWGLGRIGLARDTQIPYSQNQKINSRIEGNPRRERREWGRRRREQRRCFATTARGSSRTRRFLFSTRRPSTSSAMSATRSSPPPLAWPSTSSRSTRRPSPSTFALLPILSFSFYSIHPSLFFSNFGGILYQSLASSITRFLLLFDCWKYRI